MQLRVYSRTDPHSALLSMMTATILNPQATCIQPLDLVITLYHGGTLSGSNPKSLHIVPVILAWHVGGCADISAAGFILMGAFSRTIQPIIPSAHSLTEHLSLHIELIIIN